MANKASTAARGYGAAHKAERAKAKQMVDAGLAYCSRCGNWIHPEEPFDLDHTDDRQGYAGPAHRSCNRRAGAVKGNRRRWGGGKQGVSRRSPRAARPRARLCEICGTEYRASHADQRTCGRACGMEMRRRNAPPPVTRPARTYDRSCSECGQQFTTAQPRQVTCSSSCSKTRAGRKSREHYHLNPEYRAATIERSKRRWKL